MPELPEVQTTVDGIRPYLLNKTITACNVSVKKLRWDLENDLPDKKKCYVFHENENFQLIKTIRLPDYLLYLIKKN